MKRNMLQTTKYTKGQGGKFNMKLKHILVSTLVGFAILSFQPSLANAETESTISEAETSTITTTNEVTQKNNRTRNTVHSTYSDHDEAANLLEDVNSIKENNPEVEDELDEDTEIHTEAEIIESNSEEEFGSHLEEDNDSDSNVDSNEEIVNEDEESNLEDSDEENQPLSDVEVEIAEEEQYSTMMESASEQINLNGKEVIQLKKDLTKLGFGRFPEKPSETYGNVTSNVVKEFQTTYGLTVDGIANSTTLSTLRYVLNNSFTIGDKSDGVTKLKKELTQLGFGRFPTNPSQTYGNVTANVVMEFQQHYKLRLSGIADTITLAKVKEILETPYRNGDRGLHIVELKKKLTTLGFGNFPTNPSISYGQVTSNVVSEFQKEYGLKNNGIAYQETLDKLEQTLRNSLKNGDKNTKVRNLKKSLSLLGFGNFPNNPSTTYGNVTANVVKEFQTVYGMRVSGTADEKTLNKLREILEPPYTSGESGRHIVTLKQNLSALGFGNFPTNPSENYGSVTANVVKDFQKFFGLNQNGVVNTEELQIINEGLHNPIISQSVTSMKKHLTKLGFGSFPNNPSKTYGKVTSRVVKEFQQYYGIKVTGNADLFTLRTLNENVNSNYQSGKSSSRIAKMKKDLRNLGFGNFPKKPSRNYGAVTERVVREFQRSYGLIENGIMDSVSLDVLKRHSSKITIFIDAGHGGSDPGASGNGLREKDITLDISKRVQSLLLGQGYHVIMSRENDTYLDLEERSKKANDANANLLVSIHINAGGGSGIETWWNDKNSHAKGSEQLAKDVQSEIIKSTKMSDRGVKGRGSNRGDFHMTREPKMPSALVEVGFIDTKSDADKLKNKSFLQRAAEGIVNGIKKFFS